LSNYFFKKGKKCQKKAKKAILKIATECFGNEVKIDWEWHDSIEIPEFSIHTTELSPAKVALYKIALSEWFSQLISQQLIAINIKENSCFFSTYYLQK
tara:strand:+ start:1311 stop:1604 length:294 start_codon:yes stop_codon:yes gene_type:complete